MLSLTAKTIRANKARFFLTGIAVLLGVAFMAGTFVLTDTIKKSYDDISANVYRSTDAVVRSAQSTESGDPGAKDLSRASCSESYLQLRLQMSEPIAVEESSGLQHLATRQR